MKPMPYCPGCGKPLPPDAPAGLCPQCLLKSEAPTLAETGGAPEASPRSVPVPGQPFGSYRILRLLGQGGMGQVYEAEQIQTGRRVALKVMNHALASDADRKRFLREGRLAALVNHPNVVYIHGSEEVGGLPVICMELVHGGTLRDWLKREGPLPIPKAIECALQIIAGLEAAQSAGVLHRDIKPANCFLDVDGTVKVGDFGLSVSTLARGESLLTATGSVLGTPAYASPEQLRGEELDATSDIYSVGATLYHLLTGKTPFGATDFVKLITEVLDKEPQSPSSIRQEIPAELSRVLLRALSKDRRARYQTYADFRQALLPFSAAELEPANPARRFLAALVDDLVAYAPSFLFLIYWSFDPLDKLARERTLSAALVWFPFYLWYLLYYTVLEGRWGAGLGKTVCGLRVIGPGRQAPGPWRALVRTAIYMLPFTAPSFLVMAFTPLAKMRAALAHDHTLFTDWAWLPLTVLLFVTMRRRNGYAAIHDLVSGTRVIVRPKIEARSLVSKNIAVSHAAARTLSELYLGQRLGPYEMQGELRKAALQAQGGTNNENRGEELLLAFDPALRRKVWIHMRPATARPIASERRDLNRPGRLRWLNGGRTDTEIWDAYEGPEGAPFLMVHNQELDWAAVRFWLLDLAEEMSAALKTGQAKPLLSLDRVWITAQGRAMLLDFACPGLETDFSAPAALADVGSMQRFLNVVATESLCEPAPLHAQAFLSSLAKGAFEQSEFIVGNLRSLISKPAQITRAWRAASLASVPLVIILFGVLIAGMVNFESIRTQRRWANLYPGRPSFIPPGQLYLSAVEESKQGTPGKDAELLGAYLVNHFGDLLTNEAFWAHSELLGSFSEAERVRLRQAGSVYSTPAPEILQEAETTVPQRIQEQERQQRFVSGWAFIGISLCGAAIFAFVELAGCFAFRQSPILRLFGIAVVDREGYPARRWRLVWRSLVIWLPLGTIGFVIAGALSVSLAAKAAMLDLPAIYSSTASVFGLALAISGLAACFAVIAYAAWRPARGLADRLAGTRLVAR